MQKAISLLPDHLRRYVVTQNYDKYTYIDQAVWRFIMRLLKDHLSKHAHECYLDGLKKTGITTESIPRIENIDKKLQEFGWRAIPVSGFIPPAAFMELQSLGFLPIASDMRTLEHLTYTPAPDIVHEAAGHAPILINEHFSEYLQSYAQVAKKAIINKEDLDIYNAIRKLSDIKESNTSTDEDIKNAEDELNKANEKTHEPSEAALLARMNWWTAEYGLIGNIDQPKIYGAGLLSSVGESQTALSKDTKKIPFSLNCIDYSYDITEPQPQLFVASDFKDLKKALLEMSEQMAYKIGGYKGLEKAKASKVPNTVVYNSNLQVSGVLSDYLTQNKSPIYLSFTGPTQLCYQDQELKGHSIKRHPEGFGSPVGFLKGDAKCLSQFSESELKSKSIQIGNKTELVFESGIIVKGVLKSLTYKNNQLLLMTFTDCKASYKNQILFDPTWGEYDMAVGSKISSVFGGPADTSTYPRTDDFEAARVPDKLSSKDETKLNEIFKRIRLLRESTKYQLSDIKTIWDDFQKIDSKNWLVMIELFELTKNINAKDDFVQSLETELLDIAKQSSQKESIMAALQIISTQETASL